MILNTVSSFWHKIPQYTQQLVIEVFIPIIINPRRLSLQSISWWQRFSKVFLSKYFIYVMYIVHVHAFSGPRCTCRVWFHQSLHIQPGPVNPLGVRQWTLALHTHLPVWTEGTTEVSPLWRRPVMAESLERLKILSRQLQMSYVNKTEISKYTFPPRYLDYPVYNHLRRPCLNFE